MERKEIFYCNLTLQKGKDKIELKNIVYKETDGFYKNIRYGINEPLKVIKFDIITSLGFENTASGFTEVKKSEEKRNTITGAYD